MWLISGLLHNQSKAAHHSGSVANPDTHSNAAGNYQGNAASGGGEILNPNFPWPFAVQYPQFPPWSWVPPVGVMNPREGSASAQTAGPANSHSKNCADSEDSITPFVSDSQGQIQDFRIGGSSKGVQSAQKYFCDHAQLLCKLHPF